MKTRVIQDEPEEPTTHEHPVDPPQPKSRTNLASRMARWCAQHRKKAIFGCDPPPNGTEEHR